jgi:hypothetical protein
MPRKSKTVPKTRISLPSAIAFQIEHITKDRGIDTQAAICGCLARHFLPYLNHPFFHENNMLPTDVDNLDLEMLR